MPLIIKSSIEPEGVVGIWHNVEGDAYFEQKLALFDVERHELSLLRGRKRSEWLCSRYLLHLLSGRHDRGACLKDAFGKPYLDGSDYFISISHSSEYTGIIASPLVVGIDIQILVDKIVRIRSKFVSKDEESYIDTDHPLYDLHTIWGAKEAMYKAYGKRELDFIGHMVNSQFIFDKNGFSWQGFVKKGEFYKKYDLFCFLIDQLIIVYAIQTD
jgi:4'-phosphopantetheinyl transferase